MLGGTPLARRAPAPTPTFGIAAPRYEIRANLGELSGLRTKMLDVDIVTDRPATPDEIEVTPEMMEVGAYELMEWERAAAFRAIVAVKARYGRSCLR